MDGVVDPAAGLLHADAPPLGLFCSGEGREREKRGKRECERKKVEVEVPRFQLKKTSKFLIPAALSFSL